MNAASVAAIEYVLPERCETNEDLVREFPDLSATRMFAKTGIASRRIASENECASDLAVRAAQRLFATGVCEAGEIDFVLFCTQTPDYILPTTACSIQARLGVSQAAGALDFNLGCSGYIYGLSLAKGLIETGQARAILLLTGDTYSKLIEPGDRNVRSIFGDAATATLLRAEALDRPAIGPFVFGTDGGGAENLMVRSGGFRNPAGVGSTPKLEMNGPEIFNFTLRVVPDSVSQLLARASTKEEEVDLFVPHQANSYMLEHLRKKMNIAPAKFYIGMRDFGNTVSSSIPIALKDAAAAGLLHRESLAMLLGFGVGYSWGGCFLHWRA